LNVCRWRSTNAPSLVTAAPATHRGPLSATGRLTARPFKNGCGPTSRYQMASMASSSDTGVLTRCQSTGGGVLGQWVVLPSSGWVVRSASVSLPTRLSLLVCSRGSGIALRKPRHELRERARPGPHDGRSRICGGAGRGGAAVVARRRAGAGGTWVCSSRRRRRAPARLRPRARRDRTDGSYGSRAS
jgi:hypothetical protein